MFFSDLDRTLIYSNKFEINNEVLIEEKNGEAISYISSKTLFLLKKLCNKNLFVPVTTRTQEQFERISLFKTKYAIIENGAKILINGKIDKEWESHIFNSFKNQSTKSDMIFKEFEKYKGNWILKEKNVDDEFYYFIIDVNNIPENINNFFRFLKINNWNYSIQGRKMYFIPNFISKEKAVSYVVNKESIKKYFASGDSNLDLNMVLQATYNLIPLHAEINRVNGLNFTKKSGIKASEEILEKYIKLFKSIIN
ncbi:hypothetical protein OSSY52_07440 [Tepiditoga spiralis]|uniref:Sucrose phosphatase-like domain-containing protein n=1 Tax=Tepiditoga spiralis TaxID=2108365 RepID=A0A7G1G6W6_9BACT|nr:hypothetical protein [Tepiditoga spiralis]BBE30603.1 hypothetical protein OSSY52_07440 [Tepiditoga spiralis]